MEGILQIAGPIFALIGFIQWARALFMPKRFYAKRPRLMFGGLACVLSAALCLWIGYGGMAQDVHEAVSPGAISLMAR